MASTDQPAWARASTVAAPIPRPAPVTSATAARSCAGAPPADASRRLHVADSGRAASASSRARPSSAVAPVGSPRMPVSLTARTPALRSCGQVSRAAGCPRAPPGPCAPGRVQVQHHRRLRAARMRVAVPARLEQQHVAGTPARSRRPPGPPAARSRRARTPAPGGRSVSAADRPSSSSEQFQCAQADGQRAGEARVLAAGPVADRRGDQHVRRGPRPAGRTAPPRCRCRWTAAGAGRAARWTRPARPARRRPRPAGRSPARTGRRAATQPSGGANPASGLASHSLTGGRPGQRRAGLGRGAATVRCEWSRRRPRRGRGIRRGQRALAVPVHALRVRSVQRQAGEELRGHAAAAARRRMPSRTRRPRRTAAGAARRTAPTPATPGESARLADVAGQEAGVDGERAGVHVADRVDQADHPPGAAQVQPGQRRRRSRSGGRTSRRSARCRRARPASRRARRCWPAVGCSSSQTSAPRPDGRSRVMPQLRAEAVGDAP